MIQMSKGLVDSRYSFCEGAGILSTKKICTFPWSQYNNIEFLITWSTQFVHASVILQ